MNPSEPYITQNPTIIGNLSVSFNENLEEQIMEFLNQDVYKNSLILGLILETGFGKLLENNVLQVYQNNFGELEGVGYIGKKNFFFTTTYDALVFFSKIIAKQPKGSLVLCEKEVSDKFNRLLSLYNRKITSYCLENLMIVSENVGDLTKTNFLRFANENDFHLVLNANAEIIELERGYNPLVSYRADFEESINNLIKKQRSMIWREADELVCKIDIGVITPKVVYLEGIYVSPKYRGKGIAFQCIQEVKNNLMKNEVSLSLLVKNNNQSAINLYKKLGFYDYCKFDFFCIQ